MYDLEAVKFEQVFRVVNGSKIVVKGAKRFYLNSGINYICLYCDYSSYLDINIFDFAYYYDEKTYEVKYTVFIDNKGQMRYTKH